MSQLLAFLKGLGKAGTIAAAIAAAVWAIWTYEHQSRLNYQRPMVEQHIKICMDAAEAASSLPSSQNEAEWQLNQSKFRALKWGRLLIVEDDAIAGAMGALNAKLFETDFAHRRQLEAESKAVGLACRAHLEDVMAEGWRIENINYQIFGPFTF